MSIDPQQLESRLDELRLDFHATLEHLAWELSDEEARFRDIVFRSEDGIVVLDASSRIVYANPAAERMLGRPATELLGERLDVGPAGVEVRRPDAVTVRLEVSSGQTDWDGEMISILSLRRPNGVAALALEASGDGVWDWNLAANEFTADGAWLKLAGIEDGPDERGPELWLRRIHTADLDRVAAALADHVRGESERLSVRFRMRRGDRWVRMLARGRVTRDDRKRPARISGLLTQIS